MNGMQPGAAPPVSLKTPMELFVECDKLTNRDKFSKSDPVCLVTQLDPNTQQWFEVGRTELLKDNLNPKFMRPVRIDYCFEKVQRIRFSIIDIDSESYVEGRPISITSNDLIGQTECQLANIITARNQTFVASLYVGQSQAPQGAICIRAEEVVTTGVMGSAVYQIAAVDLMNMDGMFGKSDPFLVFNRLREDGSVVPVAKTEVIRDNLNPIWRPLEVTSQMLCNGDLERPVQVECWDWEKSGKNQFIGSFRAPMRAFVPGAQFTLWSPEKAEHRKKKGKPYNGSGTIVFRAAGFQRSYSFMDFLKAGLPIECMVSIDFTGSNLPPVQSNSLHYIPPGTPLKIDPITTPPEKLTPVNGYEAAILSVGAVLQPYDSDGIMASYAFGARLPPNWQVSHCFPLDEHAKGVAGVFSAYRNSVMNVQFYGPTIFAQTIRTLCAKASADLSKYYILLILTDGEISDMDETVEALVDASALPISVIIVGIGSESFANMRILDGDEHRLTGRSGRSVQRDVVQFVPFRDFQSRPLHLLAEAVCAELPQQVLQYAKVNNITPDAVAAYQQRMSKAASAPASSQLPPPPPY